MCGIVGIHSKKVALEWRDLTVKAMLHAVRHRGPDQTSLQHVGPATTLGSVRLSMLDPKGSEQPLTNEDTTIKLFFNGEIYNHRSLRQDLAASHSFRSCGDGEVIVHLYEEYGISAFEKLDGMFAFALWDARNDKLILARDRYGCKPLYFAAYDDEFFFASELKAFYKCGIDMNIDSAGLKKYYDYRFVPAPASIFENIQKLIAGHMVVFDTLSSVWHCQSLGEQQWEHGKSTVSLADELAQAVRLTLDSDRPLGIFLSGGLDSVAIASLAREITDLPAFSIGYTETPETQDMLHARRVARRLNLRHHTIAVTAEDVSSCLGQMVEALDEPLFSSVSPSIFLLAQFAKEHVTGVLTGDGADELLWGYDYARRIYAASQIEQTQKYDITAAYKAAIGWVPERLQRILDPEWIAGVPFEKPIFCTGRVDQTWEAIWDFECRYRLADYHLHRGDRLLMHFGLECRYPFLVNRFAKVARRLSPETGLGAPIEKQNLRRSLADIGIPEQDLERTKSPFSAPIAEWLKGSLKVEVLDLLATTRIISSLGLSRAGLTFLLDAFYINKNYTLAPSLWGCFLVAKWFQRHRELLNSSSGLPNR